VGRTFIEPEQRVRDFGVRLKLNPVRNLLEGKRVVLIDDSIIRGTTSRKIVRMVRGAGAKEVHLRISCPPTISPCFYGVDTPRKQDLIAANNSIEEIRRFIEADSLAYLSLEGLLKACDGGFCVACYTGNYPTAWVDVDEILPAAVSI
jgi:amidophosphoribosyltransferase